MFVRLAATFPKWVTSALTETPAPSWRHPLNPAKPLNRTHRHTEIISDLSQNVTAATANLDPPDPAARQLANLRVTSARLLAVTRRRTIALLATTLPQAIGADAVVRRNVVKGLPGLKTRLNILEVDGCFLAWNRSPLRR